MIWMILDTFVVSSSCDTLENHANVVCWKRVRCISWLSVVTYFLIPQGGLGALCIPALMLGCALGVTGPPGTHPSFLCLAAADEVVPRGSASSTLRFLLTIRLIFLSCCDLAHVHGFWIFSIKTVFCILLCCCWVHGYECLSSDTAEQFWLAHTIVIGLTTWSLGCGDKEDDLVFFLKEWLMGNHSLNSESSTAY